jgi:antitoxin YefM
METKTYTHVRQNLARVMDEICDKKAPMVVTRQDARPVVMMPLEEYHALEETLHLMRSPRNAGRLLKSIAQAKAGKVRKLKLPRR